VTGKNEQRKVTLAVAAEACGARLDLFLAESTGVSRKEAKRALDGGRVFVDGATERRASRSLAGGEMIVATLAAPSPAPAPPVVLYRDELLLATAKPAGVSSHPTGSGRPDALSAVTSLFDPGAPPPILLHRLDVDTTGVLLFALGAAANRELARQFAGREVQKIYLALVAGAPPESFRVANHLRAKSGERTVAVAAGGQRAETDFCTVAGISGCALVEARPHTGRTHQIRAHLAGEGYPLLGDRLYGGPSTLAVDGHRLAFVRHLLHAWRLSVRHPASGALLTLEAPVPDDFIPIAEAAGWGDDIFISQESDR
jgi:23S rRNA pseudouridine1911/1915/1917 synthase